MLSGNTEDDANVVIVPSTTLAVNRMEAAAIVTRNVFDWKGVEVPQAVHISLSTPYRGNINTGKLLPTLLSHPDVPDAVKQKLTNGAHASCAVEWRDAWHKKRKSVESSGFVALACVEDYPDQGSISV
ncbi:hypothetical protein CYMTET_7784 [Cymbomonas tetramitiformis]|uniref:Uncharacterized protein n=1 Tax=Cymbomonas tetramitiformis TaxID=36881 RepID=A0AAE0GUZ5_9CHLO|nr:hypothetical protein CYMTET_7784 [Cymbomonas tetramitiformis]